MKEKKRVVNTPTPPEKNLKYVEFCYPLTSNYVKLILMIKKYRVLGIYMYNEPCSCSSKLQID